MRSLRARLVLISTLLPGMAIVGVSALAWYYMVRAVRESVDLRLEGIVGRIARDLHPRADWEVFRERMDITYGDDIAEGRLMMKIRDDINDGVVYESSNTVVELEQEFPAGFPERPPNPQARPEWSLASVKGGKAGEDGPPPGKGKGKGKGKAKAAEGALSPYDVNEMVEELERPGPGKGGEMPTRLRFEPTFQQVSAFDKDWRVIVLQERGYFVMAALDLTPAIAELERMELGLLVGVPLAIALIGLGGWLVADRALSPIRKISEAASQITTRDLGERMPESRDNDPEIARLTAVLNDMMDRLEKGFSHATRFSADVSHELKTPIAVMQGEIESAMRECEPGTEEENRLIVLREETSRLKSIIRSLMLLAQADVGDLIRRQYPVHLSKELQALVEDGEIMAEAEDISIKSEITEDVVVLGDAVLLRQALLNLINNAIKYNCEGGFVRIVLERDDELINLAVENTGPGISGESRVRIFERFYRADQARSRGVDGFGLGLSLAKAVIDGHGGKLRLADSEEDLTRFEVKLPKPDPADLKEALKLLDMDRSTRHASF